MNANEGGVAVQYNGHRPIFRDASYGSNLEFAQGETKLVPSALADKLLKHVGVFTQGKAAKGAKLEAAAVEDKPENETEKTQPERDAVANMGKDALEHYARTHFRIELDKRKGVGALRSQVTGLIDQYGAPQ